MASVVGNSRFQPQKPCTRLNISGLFSEQFLQNRSNELQRLRHQVQQKHQYTKDYNDRRRAVKIPRFRVGVWVRVKKSGKVAKGESAFGPPLCTMKRVGWWTFQLEDGRVWNALKLATAPEPSQASHQQRTPAAVQSDQPSHAATLAADNSAKLQSSGNSWGEQRRQNPQRPHQRRRTPAPFHGESYEDIDDQVQQYEREALHNGWTREQCVQNAYVALEATVRN
ncbi:hypothetical protein HPB47_023243 [Ixodes persulcatus]|uniref:Uncharacterized protein n=1 Tax=Ixodes persulcatus TaxID=34615 RepID=A0AC60Q7X1_IXOPE|nr:hypothetical protein HPB47_023243 [Ixodes persulcatus]